MANLTIDFDEEVLKQARTRALGENTSVNDVLGEYPWHTRAWMEFGVIV